MSDLKSTRLRGAKSFEQFYLLLSTPSNIRLPSNILKKSVDIRPLTNEGKIFERIRIGLLNNSSLWGKISDCRHGKSHHSIITDNDPNLNFLTPQEAKNISKNTSYAEIIRNCISVIGILKLLKSNRTTIYNPTLMGSIDNPITMYLILKLQSMGIRPYPANLQGILSQKISPELYQVIKGNSPDYLIRFFNKHQILHSNLEKFRETFSLLKEKISVSDTFQSLLQILKRDSSFLNSAVSKIYKLYSLGKIIEHTKKEYDKRVRVEVRPKPKLIAVPDRPEIDKKVCLANPMFEDHTAYPASKEVIALLNSNRFLFKDIEVALKGSGLTLNLSASGVKILKVKRPNGWEISIIVDINRRDGTFGQTIERFFISTSPHTKILSSSMQRSFRCISHNGIDGPTWSSGLHKSVTELHKAHPYLATRAGSSEWKAYILHYRRLAELVEPSILTFKDRVYRFIYRIFNPNKFLN